MVQPESDEEDVLFDVDADEDEASSASASDRDEPAASAGCGSSSVSVLDRLLQQFGSADATFDPLRPAREATARAAAGQHWAAGPSPEGVEACVRRLLWSRWLGILSGETPRAWLAQARQHRSDFNNLLRRAEERDDHGSHQLRRQVDVDLDRCFPDHPVFQTSEARMAMRSILLAYAEQQDSIRKPDQRPVSIEQHYFQGFHELAAVALQVCWDGSCKVDMDEPVMEAADNASVFAELSAPGPAATADAMAILSAVLHHCRLIEMFEPPKRDSQQEVVGRCHRLISALALVEPNIHREIATWSLEPQVLLLRWVRLLFIRDLPFPGGVLITWDALFADAAERRSLPNAGETPKGNDPLPLADFVALAMILDAEPTAPERLLRYWDYPCNVADVLSLACALQDSADSSPLAPGPAAAAALRAWRTQQGRRRRGDAVPSPPRSRSASTLEGLPTTLAMPSAASPDAVGSFPQPPPARMAGGTAGLLASAPMGGHQASRGYKGQYWGSPGQHDPLSQSYSSASAASDMPGDDSTLRLGVGEAQVLAGKALGWAASQFEKAAASARDAIIGDPNLPWGAYDGEMPRPRRPSDYGGHEDISEPSRGSTTLPEERPRQKRGNRRPPGYGSHEDIAEPSRGSATLPEDLQRPQRPPGSALEESVGEFFSGSAASAPASRGAERQQQRRPRHTPNLEQSRGESSSASTDHATAQHGNMPRADLRGANAAASQRGREGPRQPGRQQAQNDADGDPRWNQSDQGVAQHLAQLHKAEDERRRGQEASPAPVDIWTGAAKGSIESVIARLQEGANLNQCDSETMHSPLGWAVGFAQKGMVSWLLQAQASPDATMRDDSTALHVAAFFGRADQAAQLLEAGANVDAQSRSPLGKTPWDMSCADMAITAQVAKSFKLQIGAREVSEGREQVRRLLQQARSAPAESSQTHVAKPREKQHAKPVPTSSVRSTEEHHAHPGATLSGLQVQSDAGQQLQSAPSGVHISAGAGSYKPNEQPPSALKTTSAGRSKVNGRGSKLPMEQSTEIPRQAIPSWLLDADCGEPAQDRNRQVETPAAESMLTESLTSAHQGLQQGAVASDYPGFARDDISEAVDLKGLQRIPLMTDDLNYEGAVDAKALASWEQQRSAGRGTPEGQDHWTGHMRQPDPALPMIYEGAVDEKAVRRGAVPSQDQHPGAWSQYPGPAEVFQQRDPVAVPSDAETSGRLADAIARLERGDAPRDAVLAELRAIQASMR